MRPSTRLVIVAMPMTPAERTSRSLILRKAASSAELAADELVHHLAVDGLAGQAGHDGFHHTPHVFRRSRASRSYRRIDSALEVGRINGGRQIAFQDGNLGGLLVGEVLPAALEKLRDRITALLDQRGNDL